MSSKTNDVCTKVKSYHMNCDDLADKNERKILADIVAFFFRQIACYLVALTMLND